MDNFTWINVYNKIAHKMLEYKNKPKEFVELMCKTAEDAGMENVRTSRTYMDVVNGQTCMYDEIDPISFMNKFDMYSHAKRSKLIEAFQKNTGMEIDIPKDYDGIPSTHSLSSSIVRWKDDRDSDDVSNIWELFEVALTGDLSNEQDKAKFIEFYDKVTSKPYAKYNISVGLFKVRPDVYINLDSTNREYLRKKFKIKIDKCPTGSEYLELLEDIKTRLAKDNQSILDFSHKAWLSRQQQGKHYWIYSPGENAYMWDYCKENGKMVLGYNEIGDLNLLEEYTELEKAVKEAYYKENPMHDKCALDDFKNNMQVGDIVIAKKGVKKLIGYGEVISDYYYDTERETYKHTRDVKWIKTGMWNVEDVEGQKQVVSKTLTDLTKYGEYPMKFLRLMEGESEPVSQDRNYFWLNANPKIWSFSELKVGECIEYTAVNESGNKRRIYRNFENAKKGDMVIAYESNPTKAIVGLCVVEEELKDNIIKIKKLETLINPIPLADIQSAPELSNTEYRQNPQGSLFVLTENEYNYILDVVREVNINNHKEVDSYTKQDFLSKVYMSEDEYDKLCNLLDRKKNIILQGAPGVGKTYMAKKLAYSIMGCKDDSRIKFVQFHQSYSYEDFVEGFRPTETTYKLEQGVFFNFCEQAKNNPDKKYFFIIDEINRGNLSKIFGELLMLIEKDKRDEKLSLAYSKKAFSVPENLYIIGMMNTADRSLAMIDYALRRRFAFYKVKPAFENDKFIEYKNSLDNAKFNKLIDTIKVINAEIREDLSLGEGFEIGHSYFCELDKVTDMDIESIVTYEILPLLEEYWFDNTDKYNEWKDKLNGVVNG